MAPNSKSQVREVAQFFFKLGCIAFGGPASHIAMMEDEVVEKKKWMTRQHFLDLLGATNLIPGPNSTEMTMHCGYERAGWKGLIVGGGLFIFPSVSITLFIAWLYVKYGQLPQVEPFIYGIKPAVIAIIISAAYKLGGKAIKGPVLAVLFVLTVVICLLGVHEVMALFGCGIMGILIYLSQNFKNIRFNILPFFIVQLGSWKTLLIFLKVGSILYGSGYVLFAFLDAELVSTGLLARQELIDAVAVGQMTPGPVLSTATFIGYQLGGFSGAIAATVGIFLPSFILVTILNPLVHKIRKSKILSSFIDAVNAAAVAVIVVVCIEMGMETIIDWRTIVIALVSLIFVFLFKKINSAFIVLGGGLLGYALNFI